LVVTGELTRSQALEELTKAAYTENEIKEEKTYIAKKLGISEIEFEQYMNAPCTTAKDFPNNSVLFTKAKIIREKIRKII
jgi:hypothetical protein